MPITKDNCCLIVFAKAPIPGQVKTRLELDGEMAAMLHSALVERTLDVAQRSGIAEIELCCAPDTTHSFFEACADDFDVVLTDQGEGNLGDRMLHALQRALEDYAAAIVVGSDCPALTGKHLAEAMAALNVHDAVLTPAEDGGYVLVGATRTDPAMFNAVDWSSGHVLEQQRRNFTALGFHWHEMATLWDVDRPEDLPRLKALKPPLEFFWPQ